MWRLLAAVLVALIGLAAPPARSQTGIGVVPFARGEGDEVEQLLHEIIARLPAITGIWAPTPSFDALLSALERARDEGRRIDLMVIGAHGNRTATATNTPALGFPAEDLVPADIDLAAMERRRDRLLERLLDARRAPDPRLCAEWRELRDRLDRLRKVAEAFTPGARILLVNCGAAGSPEGERFVKDLGTILLGRNGGMITASRIDVDLGTDSALARARFWRSSGGRGAVYPVGPYFFAGDFVDFAIAPGEAAPTAFARDLAGSVSVRVLEGGTDGVVPSATVTILAGTRSVLAGTSPANGDPLLLRPPAVLAGTPMHDSTDRATDPSALQRYVARVEAPGFLPAEVAFAVSPDRDLDAACRRVRPLDLVVRLARAPAAKDPAATVRLELVEAIADPNAFEGSTVDPAGGLIRYDHPCCGRSEHRWDPPPARIEPGDRVYPIGISVTAVSNPRSSLVAGVTVKLFAGLGLEDPAAPTAVEVVSRDAVAASASTRFAFRPPAELAAWPEGADAWILVEGGGRTVYYHYRVVR